MVEFQVKYNNQTFSFKYGADVYIFHTGLLNEFDRKYGLKTLLEYVDFVNACYLKDSNRTPLGALADFIAENWDRVKHLDRYTLLANFYQQYE